MKQKRIKIQFEKVSNNPVMYEVTQMCNGLLVDWPGLKAGEQLTIGTQVTHLQCDDIARCNSFDVVISNTF